MKTPPDPAPRGLGNVDADRLVKDHEVEVWRYLRFLGCRATEAEELAQEAFLSVLRRPFTYRSRPATSAYLLKTARNLYLKSLRKRSRQVNQVELQEAELAWRFFVERSREGVFLDALRTCVSELDDSSRGGRAMVLRYRNSLSYQQIARELGMRPEGVRSLLRRMKERIRQCVERRVGS